MLRTLLVLASLGLPAAAQATAFFATDGAPARAEPRHDSAIVARLAVCAGFESVRVVNGFLETRIDGRILWVPSVSVDNSSRPCIGDNGGFDAPAVTEAPAEPSREA